MKKPINQFLTKDQRAHCNSSLLILPNGQLCYNPSPEAQLPIFGHQMFPDIGNNICEFSFSPQPQAHNNVIE